MSDLEILKNDSNYGHGGKRAGAGRPKGTENAETKARRIAEASMKSRIVKSTDALLNAQMQLAQGESNLYRIHYEGEGKNRKKIVDIVTSQEIISDYLADTLDNSDDEYYYIATKSPDNKSIDSLLDRTYGKAKQHVDLTSDDEKLGVSLSAEQFDQLARARAKRADS